MTATAPISLTEQQHLVMHGVSWDFYSRVLEAIGDGALRVTFNDGSIEIYSPGSPIDPQHLVLEDVSWDFYTRVLEEIGNGAMRVTFDDGRIEIMSPLPEHEDAKKAIARLLEAMADELDLPLHGFGSTTFRRKDRRKGLEPDECYYLKNEDRVRGMKRFDPAIHPAPDLAIEIDVFGRSIEREPIYAKLGVPELWRYNDGKISVKLLQPDMTYAAVPRSPAFPFLPIAEFERFIPRMELERQTSVSREFRQWVKSLPR